ncbi:hypothetical protein KEM48_004512 [Puccinia striiformis f. sp. tritici PST-130]|nr:hypothetical protein H4Q26_004093 [Puccinia striiformis f. sp. tritici PST-130]KAI9611272.1 hypothetical protein KEM48_004512 [Puccinia striiformis f. sp. tritici PST-130]
MSNTHPGTASIAELISTHDFSGLPTGQPLGDAVGKLRTRREDKVQIPTVFHSLVLGTNIFSWVYLTLDFRGIGSENPD